MTATRAGKKWPACRHKLDPAFPQEQIPGFLVGRCLRCWCIVAVVTKVLNARS